MSQEEGAGGDRPPSGTRTRPAWRSVLPRRFVVHDRSMEPTLPEGTGLIGIPWPWAHAGQLRCAEHPERDGFWLVKRVAGGSGDRMTLTSDNDSVPTVDSAAFGSVPIAGSYRVVVRVPARWIRRD